MTAVGDHVPAVYNKALEIVEALGVQYEKEHHDEVIVRKQYGVDGDVRVDRSRQYPSPFTGRPRLGSRLYVRSSAPRFVKVVLRELSACSIRCLRGVAARPSLTCCARTGSWTSTTKRHAARLIMVLMVYLEEHITHDVHLLLRCLFNSIQDDEIHTEAATCAKLCGWFADPDAYIPHMLPYIRGDATVPAYSNIQSVLKVIALVLGGTCVWCEVVLPPLAPSSHTSLPTDVRPSRVLSHVRDLVRALDSEEYTNSRNPAVQDAYLSCLAAVAAILNGRIGAAVGASFDATGRLRDVTNDATRLMRLLLSLERRTEWQDRIDTSLMNLAQGGGCTGVQAAIAGRFGALLQPLAVSFPDRLWHAKCAQQHLLEHAVELAGAATVAAHAADVVALVAKLLDAPLVDRAGEAAARCALSRVCVCVCVCVYV